jgi:hypothetical protein
VDNLSVGEKDLLSELKSEYEGQLLKVFESEFNAAKGLANKGYLEIDPDSDGEEWYVRLISQKPITDLDGATISSFNVSDKEVSIKLGDGRNISISIKRIKDQDEWGGIIKYVLVTSVS